MAATVDQSRMLADLDQFHRLRRIPDDSPLGEQVLAQAVTDTRVYGCCGCGLVFAIEPDGETGVFAAVVD